MTVARRVELWHEAFKESTGILKIETEVLQHEPVVVIRATVTQQDNVFTGISSANPAKSIEKDNPYEVAETSAVGRALGFAGYGIIEGIASADEMVKVGYKQDESGVIRTSVNEEPPLPIDESLPNDKKVCSAHDKPVVMFEGKSKTKKNADGTPKAYWWHKGPNGEMCFGTGYMD